MRSIGLTYLLLGTILTGLFILGIGLGSADISFSEALGALFKSSSESPEAYIIQELRLPRSLVAILAGAGLAVSGLIMQTLFTNILAGPHILGVSSGASLFVALVILAGGTIGSLTLPVAAILGALSVSTLILFISRTLSSGTLLLIIGVMIASFCSACVSLMEYYADYQALKSFVIWTMGDFSAVGAENLPILAILTVVGIAASFGSSKALNALLMGESSAHSLGFKVKSIRTWLLLVTAVLAGSITAYCGPIAFIGLAVPNLVRFIVKTANHQVMIPIVLLAGACFGLLCDIISRLPGDDRTLPVNVASALIGAPIVVIILLKYRKTMSR